MKASELRIGNFVISHKGHQCMIDEGVDIDYCEENGCEGIPITEEWLEKLGFERKKRSFNYFVNGNWDNNWDLMKYGISNYIKHPKGSDYYDYRINQDEKRIYFVHELQNLYFALTGRELEIKE